MYTLIWALGGSLLVDKTMNHKLECYNWFKHPYNVHAYPFDHDCDYFFDAKRNYMVRWEQVVAKHKPELLVGSDTLLINNVVVVTLDMSGTAVATAAQPRRQAHVSCAFVLWHEMSVDVWV